MRALILVAALALAIAPAAAAEAQAVKPAKQRGTPTMGTLAIAGLASGGKHCVTAKAGAVHGLGWVPQGSNVTVTFVSDFDPVAAITLVQLGAESPTQPARASLVSDDDSGGNLEPEIRFTTTHSGTMALVVKPFSNTEGAGCYNFKVEVQTP
jgi:hypothetical protein